MTYYYSYRMNQMREEIWSYDLLLFIQNESNERRDLELWLTTIHTKWIKWEKRSGVMTYYYSYKMNQMREEIWSYDLLLFLHNESYERRDLELWLTTIHTKWIKWEKRSGVMTYYYSYKMNQMREEIWSYDLLLFLQNESNERRDLELWLTTIHTEWIKWEKRPGVMTYYYSYRMNQMREEIWSYDLLLFIRNESNERRDLELWLTTIPTKWIIWEKRSGVMTHEYSYRMNQMREEI